jgi:hypothetical protein
MCRKVIGNLGLTFMLDCREGFKEGHTKRSQKRREARCKNFKRRTERSEEEKMGQMLFLDQLDDSG